METALKKLIDYSQTATPQKDLEQMFLPTWKVILQTIRSSAKALF